MRFDVVTPDLQKRRVSLPRCVAETLALGLLFATGLIAASEPFPVPQVDAGIGPCTADFTVSRNNKPLYNAEISVHIAYGFMGMKKMDLKIGSNSEGKARFIGLPEKVHNPPLEFVVRSNGLSKTVDFWPNVKCHSQYSVIMGGQ
ncbi:MAG TPA: hypothetical protein VFC10_10860 [Terriglobia bacterium]|nr:hypothetical protein [Terriglobia bacterium]